MSTDITLPQMETLWRTAGHLANSSFAPDGFRGKRDEVYAALLTGVELGLGPMASLRHIAVINGKPTLSAAMQLALLRRAGHRIEVIEQSPKRAAIKGTTPGGDTLEVSYTIEEAQAAGLAGKAVWKQYPSDMLWARCVTRYARRADAGATLGIYSPADWDGHDTMTLTPEEYASVTVQEPAEATPALEAGELPLRPGDEALPIMVTCPRCAVKVPTGELAEHLGIEHEGVGG